MAFRNGLDQTPVFPDKVLRPLRLPGDPDYLWGWKCACKQPNGRHRTVCSNCGEKRK